MGGIRYELLEETDVPETTPVLAGKLLCEAFGQSRPGRRGWTLLRPDYRVLVWDGDVLVGNEAGCVVGCDPPIVLHGIADAAVREGWRSAGIACTMGAMIHEEATRRGASAVICHSTKLGRLAAEHGMRAVEPGELYLRRRLRLPLPLVQNWYLRWHTDPVVPLTIDGRV